jgi:hypothetical protein
MSDFAKRLSSVIHKALLAEGVQLTSRELGPVSAAVSNCLKKDFEVVTKEVHLEIAADKKAADAKAAADKVAAANSATAAPAVPETPTEVAAEPAASWKPWHKRKK